MFADSFCSSLLLSYGNRVNVKFINFQSQNVAEIHVIHSECKIRKGNRELPSQFTVCLNSLQTDWANTHHSPHLTN